MASRAGLSTHQQNTHFPPVLVTLLPSSHRCSVPLRARLAISSRIYWKDGDQDEPNSLFDFREGNSLVSTRLSDGENWDSVEKLVWSNEDDNCRSVVVRGKLQDRGQRHSSRMNDNVQLVLTADTAVQGNNGWMKYNTRGTC